MANYQLQLRQNNEILNRNHHWHATSSGFVIELHVHRRNNGILRATNRTYYQENRVFLSETGLRSFFVNILFAEQIPVIPFTGRFLCDDGVQLIRYGPSGLPLQIPVYTVEHLVRSVLPIVRTMRNHPRNRFLSLVPLQLNLVIDEFRELQFLDDSIVFDGESLNRRLPQRDESIILDGELFEAGLSRTRTAVEALKEVRVEASSDCSICLESVDVGEIIARMPCSHLFHTTCITRWLHKKPSCPLCRASAC